MPPAKGTRFPPPCFWGGDPVHLRDFNGETLLTAVKLLLIVFYIFIASPTATHAIIDAGYEFRVPYWTRSSETKRAKGEETVEEDLDNGFYPEELKG